MFQMEQKNHPFDLEQRTLLFAKEIRDFCKLLPKNTANREYLPQIIRSSASVGSNYIEANESLSKKDFLMRIKICRKEAKETNYWLNLIAIEEGNAETRNDLQQECTELLKIFSAIIQKSV
jgi:four helix bundle protein